MKSALGAQVIRSQNLRTSLFTPKPCSNVLALCPPRYSNLQLRCVAELLEVRRDVAGGSEVPGAANTINTSAISHVGANVKAV